MSFMDKFAEFGMKLSNQRHMDAIKNGVMATLPATLAGSLFLIIRFIPIPGWTGVLEAVLGENYSSILLYPVAATFDMVGLISLIAISYYLATSYKLPALYTSLAALCGYFTLTPSFMMHNVPVLDEAIRINGVWALRFTGAQSLFVIILCAIASVEIYRLIVKKNIVITLPEMVPPNVANNFTAIIPVFFVLFSMWIIRLIVASTPFETVHNMITVLIQAPLMKLGNTFLGYATIIFFKDLFWTIGIHGPNMINPILAPMELTFQNANVAALEAGQQLPYIFTKSFRDIFIQIGGSGNTLMFTIMCAFFAKSDRIKSVGKLAMGPAIFEINEPIIFGIPVVLNPVMIVPFILSSIAGTFIGYIGMMTGLVGRLPGIALPWTTPPIINAWLASNGDWTVVLAQIITLVVTALIYFPFFRAVDRQACNEEMGISNDTTTQKAQ